MENNFKKKFGSSKVPAKKSGLALAAVWELDDEQVQSLEHKKLINDDLDEMEKQLDDGNVLDNIQSKETCRGSDEQAVEGKIIVAED